MDTVDPHIPIAKMISRYEKIVEQTRGELVVTPWWRFSCRAMLAGVIAAYRHEIDALLLLAASTQPIFRSLTKTRED